MNTALKIQNNPVREELKQYLDDQDMSISAVARATGLSNATISTWIRGKYAGDNLKIEEAVVRFLSREKERAAKPVDMNQVVEINALKRVEQVCRFAHIEGELCVITGAPGVGKSIAVKHYGKENDDAILIEVHPRYTPKNLIIDIHSECGFKKHSGIHDMMVEITSTLKDSHRLIIIDEAEHLTTDGLELIRRIHDFTGIGVVLSGTQLLIGNLRGNKGEFAQLYNRVAARANIEPMNEDDVELYVHHFLPASNGLWKDFAGKNRNSRVLSKWVKQSMRLAKINNRDVDHDIVEHAYELLIH